MSYYHRDPSRDFQSRLASWIDYVICLGRPDDADTKKEALLFGDKSEISCKGYPVLPDSFFSWILDQRTCLVNLLTKASSQKDSVSLGFPPEAHGEESRILLKKRILEAGKVAWTVVMVLISAFRSHWPKRFQKLELDQQELNNSIFHSVLLWLPLIEQDQWIPVLKYQLNFLFSDTTNQPLPKESPSHLRAGKILKGKIGKCFRVYCYGDRPRNWSWRWTILQGVKKGLPQMTDCGVTKAALTHQQRLTRLRESPEKLLESVTRMAKEAVGRITKEDWAEWEPTSWFSDNASYHYGYGKGPLFELIRDHYCCRQGLEGENLFDEICRWTAEEEIRYVFPGGLTANELIHDQTFVKYSKVFRKRLGLSVDEYSICVAQDELYRMKPVGLRFGSRVEEFRIPEYCFSLPARCREVCQENIFRPHGHVKGGISRVKFILEPLKVRPITAGDTRTNGIYKPLQKLMWKRLRRFDQFALIGEPLASQHLRNMHRKSLGFWQHFGYDEKEINDFEYASGDFSAATDQLHQDLTRACVNAVAGDHETSEVLLNALCRNKIFYDRDPLIDQHTFQLNNGEMVVDMTNGQLMGCVFSFIFLCVINCAVFRSTLEQQFEEVVPQHKPLQFKLKELPVLINGDDIGFYSPPGFHEEWCQKCLTAGLEPSLGKNFLSKDFVTLNSKLYRIHRGELAPSSQDEKIYFYQDFELIPYLNMSFLTGISKGSSESSTYTERLITSLKKADHPVHQIQFLGDTFDPNLLGLGYDAVRKIYLSPFPRTDDRVATKVRRGKTWVEKFYGKSVLAIQAGVESVRDCWFSTERCCRDKDGKMVFPTGHFLHARTVFAAYRETIANFRKQEISDVNLSIGSEPLGLGLVDNWFPQKGRQMAVKIRKTPKGGVTFHDDWAQHVSAWKRVKKTEDFDVLVDCLKEKPEKIRPLKENQFTFAKLVLGDFLRILLERPVPKCLGMRVRFLPTEEEDQVQIVPEVG